LNSLISISAEEGVRGVGFIKRESMAREENKKNLHVMRAE
jgi:hypothetical protein